MAVTDQLGAPSASAVIEGKFALAQFVREQADAAAPIVPASIYGVQAININPPTYSDTLEVFQQGGGDDKYQRRTGRRIDGTITILTGYVGRFISAVTGTTWGDTGKYGLIFEFEDYPLLHLAVYYRDADNTSLLFSNVLQDVALDSFSVPSPMELATVDIPFHSYHCPLMLAAGAQMVYDVFTADGVTTSFTLSSTPLSLVDPTWENADDFPFEKVFFVKHQPTDAIRGTRVVSGVTITGNNVTFATAPSQGKVQVLYAAAVA